MIFIELQYENGQHIARCSLSRREVRRVAHACSRTIELQAICVGKVTGWTCGQQIRTSTAAGATRIVMCLPAAPGASDPVWIRERLVGSARV